MPILRRLRQAGFSIWPFDQARPPLVIEIYPRLRTGAVNKSHAAERRRALDYPGDVADPRGGIRHVIPGRAAWWKRAHSEPAEWRGPRPGRAKLNETPLPLRFDLGNQVVTLTGNWSMSR